MPPTVVAKKFPPPNGSVDADGAVIVPLDEAGVEEAARRFAVAGVEAVAVCFLHSYRFPDHERRARAILERALPGVYVSLSSDVLPEFREYERLSTTVLNAAVGPRMGGYLDRFLASARRLGIAAEPQTVHSNGGLMSPAAVRERPVRTCLSGPAAGVIGSAEIGRLAGFPDLVTFDVGGTSTDVSLIDGERPPFTSERLVAGYPVVKTPMVDIHVIGAGGGSIARIDAAGALKVGPDSAGAAPGPAAYGRGGTEPTITDANICLGRLDPAALLGGRLAVDAEAARAAIRRRVAEPLGLTLEKTAHGILLSDIGMDFVRSAMERVDASSWPTLTALFAELREEASGWLDREGIAPADRAFHRSVEARYEGQNFEIPVPADDLESLGPEGFAEHFRAVHRRTHGYDVAFAGVPDLAGRALVLIANRLAGQDDYRQGVDKGIALVGDLTPNVLSFDPMPDAYAFIVNGTAALELGWNGRAQLYARQSPGRIASLVPAEGSATIKHSINLVQGAPQREAARLFIDYALGAQAQGAVADRLFLSPMNHRAAVAEATRDRIVRPEQTADWLPVDWLEMRPLRERIHEAWRRGVIARG